MVATIPKARRLSGLDLARGLALLGMLIVNYELALGASGKGPAWLATLTGSLQGRAAATFVVLAGVGASLGSARARTSGAGDLVRRARLTLLRRGAFLFVFGCAFWLIWPADILHYYGVWLVLGAGLLFASDEVLLLAHVTCVLGAALFFVYGDFFAHWNLIDLTYGDLGSPTGFFRNLFFDGWHPVLPWFALYLFGMVLGRLDLRRGVVRGWLAGAAAAVLLLVLWLEGRFAPPLGMQLVPRNLLGTTSFPPTPAFVELGACVATLMIVASLEVAERWPRACAPLASTGKLALTLYVAHVLVGLGVLEEAGRLENQTLPFAVTSALVFFCASVVFSVLWLRSHERGPLEALMRKVCG